MSAPTDTAALRKLLAEATPGELLLAEAGHSNTALVYTLDGDPPSNRVTIQLHGHQRAGLRPGEIRATAALIVTMKSALPALLDELDLLREVAAAAGEYREAMIDSGRATNEDFPVKAARIMRAMKAIDAALARLREAGR